jgi:hypothetical protein
MLDLNHGFELLGKLSKRANGELGKTWNNIVVTPG